MGYTMENIDINALRSYRIEFEYRNPEHVWNGYDDQTFLKNMGGFANQNYNSSRCICCPKQVNRYGPARKSPKRQTSHLSTKGIIYQLRG